jgi:hypothetical protein
MLTWDNILPEKTGSLFAVSSFGSLAQLFSSSSQGRLVAASAQALITLGSPSPHLAHLSSQSNLSSP